LIDSSIWIEYWKATPKGAKAKPFIEGKEDIIISTINVAEIYKYFYNKSHDLAEKYTATMMGHGNTLSVDVNIAKNAAKIRHEKKLGLGDALILATAQSKNAKLITADNDFRGETNVELIT
jgi:predicted nucleic acid-binding protein